MNISREKAIESLKDRVKDATSLIICDPYILNVPEADEALYIDTLLTILPLKLTNLVFIYSRRSNPNILKAIEENRPLTTVRALTLAEPHDRVWIINSSKAFTTGTSLNSIGKKLSFINNLPDDDLKTFLDFLVQHLGLNFNNILSDDSSNK